MFWIIEKQFIGPNDAIPFYFEERHVSIFNGPLDVPLKYDKRTVGWLGLARNWSIIGHGAFDDLAEAKKRLKLIFGECRPDDETQLEWEPNELERYLIGPYARLSPLMTQRYIEERIHRLLKRKSAGDRSTQFLEWCETEANNETLTLDLRVATAYINQCLQAVGGIRMSGH